METVVSRQTGPRRGRPMQFEDRFFAHSFNSADFGGLMNPLLMVDHFQMRLDTFGRHRHKGISALTYVFADSQTAHHNIDSMGNELSIEPGALHWFAAGRGAEHHEYPKDDGAWVHALQIFVDLPADRKLAEPFALHLGAEEVPLFQADGADVRVVSGRLHGVQSPFDAPQPFTLLDGRLEAGAEVEIPLPQGYGAWVYTVDGAVRVGTSMLAQGYALALRNAEPSLSIASSSGGQFVVIAGAPQNL